MYRFPPLEIPMNLAQGLAICIFVDDGPRRQWLSRRRPRRDPARVVPAGVANRWPWRRQTPPSRRASPAEGSRVDSERSRSSRMSVRPLRAAVTSPGVGELWDRCAGSVRSALSSRRPARPELSWRWICECVSCGLQRRCSEADDVWRRCQAGIFIRPSAFRWLGLSRREERWN